jgi:hypothetical protein
MAEQREQQEASGQQEAAGAGSASDTCALEAAASQLSTCSISAADGSRASTKQGAHAAAEPSGAAGGSSSSSAMQAAEEQLRAAEAQLDAAAWQHLQRFTIHFLTGDFAKAVSGELPPAEYDALLARCCGAGEAAAFSCLPQQVP